MVRSQVIILMKLLLDSLVLYKNISPCLILNFFPHPMSSTINLISSVMRYAGAPALYDELSTLSSAGLDSYDSVVLCLIDALGYHWIMEYAPDSFLARHMR